MRLPLIGGSYTTRSVIASAQRCINYYSEVNPKSAIVPMTHYQRPGLNPVFQAGPGPIRGLYRASNEVGYLVSGNEAHKINPNFTTTFIGAIADTGRTGQVSMADNGTTLTIVDGSSVGYESALNSTTLAPISDPTGVFQGADKIAYIDTYLIWNMPGSVFFGSTLSNELTFDPLFFAGKVSYPDILKSLFVNRREIFLFGDVKSEIWYNAGGTTESPFAFQQLPGTYIENGIAAPFSVANHDITVFWLSRNLQGEGVVLSFRGYFAQRISNHALEDAILKMQKAPGIGITDAVGM